jgi:hypothetical protein
MHVVQILEIGDDPLDRDIKDVPMMPVPGWIYMEWLDNGTLQSFLSKAEDAKRSPPNRLLWRIFMCCELALLYIRALAGH